MESGAGIPLIALALVTETLVSSKSAYINTDFSMLSPKGITVLQTSNLDGHFVIQYG